MKQQYNSTEPAEPKQPADTINEIRLQNATHRDRFEALLAKAAAKGFDRPRLLEILGRAASVIEERENDLIQYLHHHPFASRHASMRVRRLVQLQVHRALQAASVDLALTAAANQLGFTLAEVRRLREGLEWEGVEDLDEPPLPDDDPEGEGIETTEADVVNRAKQLQRETGLNYKRCYEQASIEDLKLRTGRNGGTKSRRPY